MKRNKTINQHKPFSLMHFVSLAVLLTIFIPGVVKAQMKADFSGTWTLNEEKSNLGEGRRVRFGRGDFVATQEANLLTVERTRTNREGETTTSTITYSLDGKEKVNATERSERKSTANWSADGKTLTIVTVSSFNGNERTSTEVWSLTNTNTLSITSTREGRNGEEIKTTRVYDKK